MDRILVRKKSYGIPIMLCSNVIICRKKDDKRIENIMDRDILPPPLLVLRGGGFSVKNTYVFR